MRVPVAPRSAATILPGVGYIPLRDRHGKAKAWAVVDLADFARFGGLRWYCNDGYAVRQEPRPSGGQWTQSLHRAVMGLELGDGRKVDHIDHHTLDCRRGNLRIATHAENHQNRLAVTGLGASRFRGVSLRKDRRTRPWQAYAQLNGRQSHLGFYDTEEQAAEAAPVFRREHMPFAVD